MNRTLMRHALRAVAVMIAVASAIDPAWSTLRVPPKRLVAVRMTSADSTARIEALRTAFAGWELVVRDLAGSRVPCDPAEPCVLVADGSIDGDLADDQRAPAALLDARDTRAPGVQIRGVTAYSTHQSAAGVIAVEMERRTVADEATLVTVSDGAAMVGSAKAVWGQQNRVTVDVPWWPLAAGARTLRVEAQPAAGETDLSDNRADVGVTVTDDRLAVLVVDARASWSSTFVRRALDAEPRFAVEYRAAIAPGLSAGTQAARLDARSLDRVALVVVGGPDALPAEDVDLLDRFVRRRGGSLVLLPERAPAGPVGRLFPGAWSEKLVPQPERVGLLRASEILTTSRLGPTATVLASAGEQPAVVHLPSGDGRLVIDGAMDAWRYRDQDGGAFDRFWRSLAQELAVKGAPLTVTFDDGLAPSSSRVPFTVRRRSLSPASVVEAAAVMRCNDGAAQVIRLWPSGPVGEFTGDVPASAPGSCAIEGTVDGQPFAAAIAVVDQPHRAGGMTMEKLVRRIGQLRGRVVAAGDEAALARGMAAATPATTTIVHPMRAWWWLLPFAGCLSVEWWLRRRSGLR